MSGRVFIESLYFATNFYLRDLMNPVAKFFAQTATSAVRSLLLSEVKGGVKNLIAQKRSKTFEDVQAELIQRLGYVTAHHQLNKKTQEVSYKPSSIFMHEWLTHSPSVKEDLVRDEETGAFYVDNEPLIPAKKLELINRFITATGVRAASLPSHMEGALKLVNVVDVNARKFKSSLPTWQPGVGGTSVIDSWLSKCFNIEDSFAAKLFRKWVVGTCTRIIHPGAFLDGCLTLQGPGMLGKTSFFRNLLPEDFASRAAEIACNPNNPQKFVENIIGKSICCFDELQVLDYARSTEVFKQILTTQHRDVRLAYRRDPTRFALRCGFAATTNREHFIRDPFLSRRLWVIELGTDNKLDFDYLFANRASLWSEAAAAVDAKENYFLSSEEKTKLEGRNQKYLVK